MSLNERDQLRNTILTAWRKHKENLALEPLEAQIVAIIEMHPEYHDFFTHPENASETDFPGTNPFLHLGLHLSIREQVSTNRPKGIADIYFALCKKSGDAHLAEHAMLECLGLILWDASLSGKMPDEALYLESLRKL
jgi:hypothetical protein